MNAHVAEYNGRTVPIDYVPAQRQLRVACQRIIDNGASGFVHCPDGRTFQINQTSRLAVLVRKLNALPCVGVTP